jgi:Uma2 family endonuclease
VIELLSPSDTYQRWKEKLQDYHRLGVREVWAVDVEAGEIEVLVREESGYRSLGWFSGEQPRADASADRADPHARGGVREPVRGIDDP